MSSATSVGRKTSGVRGTSVCSAQVRLLSCFTTRSSLIYVTRDCKDFDWCDACMASPEAWEAHAATHPFFPIHRKEDFLHFCYVKDRRERRQLVHNNITCDGCEEKNIRGVRHKCLQCLGMHAF